MTNEKPPTKPTQPTVVAKGSITWTVKGPEGEELPIRDYFEKHPDRLAQVKDAFEKGRVK